ncbi:22655_t:CDS:2, partial [Dentiscutata erythropus]
PDVIPKKVAAHHLPSVVDKLQPYDISEDLLGHVIGKDGVAPDDDKIKKIRDFPIPTTLRQLRAFLGLASYYRYPNFDWPFYLHTDASITGLGAVLSQLDNEVLRVKALFLNYGPFRIEVAKNLRVKG